MKFLSKDELVSLTTQRLLAYKNRLMTVHETADWENIDSISKEHPLWQETYQNVKEILSTRENVKL